MSRGGHGARDDAGHVEAIASELTAASHHVFPGPMRGQRRRAVRGIGGGSRMMMPDNPHECEPVSVMEPNDLGFGRLFWAIRDAVVVGEAASGRIVLWNPAAEGLFGYQATEVLGRPIDILIPDALKERHRAGIARYAVTGEGALIQAGAPVELPALRKDGSEITIELTLSPMEESLATGRYVLALVRDVTERKRAEAERLVLERERTARTAAEEAATTLARLQAVTDAALAYLALADLLNELLARLRDVIDVDTAAVLLLDDEDDTLVARAAKGLEEEVEQGVRIPVGRGFAGRVAAERRTITVDDIMDADVLSPILRRKGVRSLLGAPLLVEGRVVGVVHVGTFSHRRFGDDDARLLQLVADRIALAIDHARVYESERRARADAEEAVRDRDQFLSIAAHELRTPVTGIKGHAQLLRRLAMRGRLDTDRAAAYAATIEQAANHLAVLTADLLDVSRLRLGQLPLRLQAIDIAALVFTVVAAHRERLDERHPLVVEAGKDLCPVMADSQRLVQVLDNLIDNAAKYSPAGGKLQVDVQPEGDGVLIGVRDEGIGLPPGTAETIFEPFARAPNAIDRRLPGLGLGLHICRGIIERHGGHIRIESAGENQGTTASVWLSCGGAVAEPLSDNTAPSTNRL